MKATKDFLMDVNGSADMTVDGSTEPVDFRHTIAPGESLTVEGIDIILVDKDMPLSKFGNRAPIVNGLEFKIQNPDGSVAMDLTGGHPVKCNKDFLGLGIRVDPHIDINENEGWCRFRCVPATAMLLESGMSVVATVRDDLTALRHFRICVLGFSREQPK